MVQLTALGVQSQNPQIDALGAFKEGVAGAAGLDAAKKSSAEKSLQLIGAASMHALGGDINGQADPGKYEEGLDMLEGMGIDVANFRGKPQMASTAARASVTAMQQLTLAQNDKEFGLLMEKFEFEMKDADRKFGLDKQKLDAETAGGGLFAGTSVEAQGLNYLIKTGKITPEQAATIGSGKPITSPVDGSVIFLTPQGIASQMPGGEPQLVTPADEGGVPADPAAAPGADPGQPGADPGQPGPIQITGPKGVKATDTQRNRQTAVNQSFLAIGNELDRYEQLVGESGIEAVPGPAKDNLNTSRQAIMLQMKELFNLGVLNGPDLALMEKMIYDPVVDPSKEGGLANLPGQAANAVFGGSKARSVNSVKELKRMLGNIKGSVDQSMPGAAPPPAAAGGGGGYKIIGVEN